MPQPKDYTAVDFWHRRTGSFQYYIDDQQEKAARDNAPLDATYKDESGNWNQMSKLPEHHSMREAFWQQSCLVVGECPTCREINQHADGCPWRTV